MLIANLILIVLYRVASLSANCAKERGSRVAPRALKLRNRHAETRISSLEAQPAVNHRRLEVPKYFATVALKPQNSKAVSVVPTADSFAFVPHRCRVRHRWVSDLNSRSNRRDYISRTAVLEATPARYLRITRAIELPAWSSVLHRALGGD